MNMSDIPILGRFTKRGAAETAPRPPSDRVLSRDTALGEFAGLLDLFMTLPDPDVVLSKLGVTRASLRSVLGDDEISGALETRRDALLGLRWSLEPAAGSGPAARWVNDAVKEHIEMILSGAWSALPFGYSVLELIYAKGAAGRLELARSVEKPFEWFVPRVDGALEYRPGFGGGGIEGTIVDQSYKFLLTRRSPTYRNPYGEALLSRLYWAWFFRHNGWRFWGQALERVGTPLLLGKGASPAALAEQLARVVQDAVIAVGSDDDVSAITVGNFGANFAQFEEALVRRINRRVLGQTLTSGTDNAGSRALGDVHDRVRGDKLEADIKLCAPTVQRAVNALCALNFPAATPPRFVLQSPRGLAKTRADRDGVLADKLGVRFKPEYIARAYALETADFTLAPLTAPVAATLAASGAAETRFAADPAEAEEGILASALAGGDGEHSPIAPADIAAAVRAATDADDLTERLARLADAQAPRMAAREFSELLARTLFAADILGYEQAAEGLVGTVRERAPGTVEATEEGDGDHGD